VLLGSRDVFTNPSAAGKAKGATLSPSTTAISPVTYNTTRRIVLKNIAIEATRAPAEESKIKYGQLLSPSSSLRLHSSTSILSPTTTNDSNAAMKQRNALDLRTLPRTIEVEWEEKYSMVYFRKYWRSKVTGDIIWENPIDFGASKPRSARGNSKLDETADIKDGDSRLITIGDSYWEEGFSNRYRRRYWRHKITSEISWTMPKDLEELEDWYNVN
jgi:hypothetical protein